MNQAKRGAYMLAYLYQECSADWPASRCRVRPTIFEVDLTSTTDDRFPGWLSIV